MNLSFTLKELLEGATRLSSCDRQFYAVLVLQKDATTTVDATGSTRCRNQASFSNEQYNDVGHQRCHGATAFCVECPVYDSIANCLGRRNRGAAFVFDTFRNGTDGLQVRTYFHAAKYIS